MFFITIETTDKQNFFLKNNKHTKTLCNFKVLLFCDITFETIMKNKNERINLAAHKLDKLQPNLIQAQLESFQDFLEKGIKEIFEEVNPIQDYTGETWELYFEDIEWGEVNMGMQEAQRLGLSYQKPLHIFVKLINKRTGEIKKQKLFVADVPMMSERGTFVVKGNERVVVMQIMRAEGLLFFELKTSTGKTPLYAVKLMPLRGRWFDFEVNKYGVMSIKLLDKRPRILLTTLLRALGYSSDKDIQKAMEGIGDLHLLESTLRRDTTTNSEEALLEIYRKLRPEDSLNLENAKVFIDNIFFNKRRFYLGKTGRYQLNKKLGNKSLITEEDYLLNKKDLVNVVKVLIQLNNGEREIDDIDSLANRRIRGVGELIGDRLRIGVLRVEKNTRDRMSTYGAEDLVTPSLLVNTKPISSSLNEFFGSSAVSRYMDQENILSELETKRRITAGGPRGLTKERASFSVRDVHSSHYSKLCPVTTPEGPSIGIVSHMAKYARVNDFGFLEAPYFRVLSNVVLGNINTDILEGQVLREDVRDQNEKVVLKKGESLTKDKIKKLISSEVANIKVETTLTNEVVYMDADDEKLYKIGRADLERDEKNRIRTGNTYVRYEGSYLNVPTTEIDFVDINPGQIAGLGFSLVPFAQNDDPTRSLMASNMQRQAVPLLVPDAPIVGTGYEKVVAESSGRLIQAKENGVVVDSESGKLTVKFEGDKKPTVYLIDKFIKTNQNTCFSQQVRVVKNQKFSKGDILVDGPSMSEGELALGRNLTAAVMVFEGYNYEDGIVISERLVREDILTSVHIKEYIQDIRETKLGDEQITRDIPNVGEHILRNLNEEGIVRVGASVGSQDILVGIIAPKGETELTAEEKLLRAIFGEYARDVRDNSLRLPHGDEGIVIGVQLLDKAKGDKLNPGVIKQVKVWVARTSKVSVGDKLTGLHGDKGVVSRILPEEDMPYLMDGTSVDIVLSPMFVKRMNIGQLKELELAQQAKQAGVKVEIPPFAQLDMSILEKLLPKDRVDVKRTLYDGRTGEAFDKKVLVGSRYIVKLNHLSSDKIHARSTGSYTLVTQQPLGGKAQFGGQRFGEMEVWALEAHAAVHNLQELLTIKSDDVVGRASAYKSIIQGTEIEAPNIPESFKVFINELRALGLNPELLDLKEDLKDDSAMVAGVVEEDIEELMKE